MSSPKHTSGADRVASVTFTDDEQTVTATKLVSMGELLLLERGDEQLRLDAMLLEGVSWQQDASELAEFVRTPDDVLGDPASSYDNELTVATEQFTIANEYTTVELGIVDTGPTPALQVTSDKGVTVLGPQTLGALTTVESTLAFSRWFRTPIGPEDPL